MKRQTVNSNEISAVRLPIHHSDETVNLHREENEEMTQRVVVDHRQRTVSVEWHPLHVGWWHCAVPTFQMP